MACRPARRSHTNITSGSSTSRGAWSGDPRSSRGETRRRCQCSTASACATRRSGRSPSATSPAGGPRCVRSSVTASLTLGRPRARPGGGGGPPIDALLTDDLAAWKAALAGAGYPTASDDFLLRGDLGGHGAPDGHMTGSQAHKWPGRYFTPAVRKVAEEWPDEHSEIIGATPYSLRRGIISLRIRAGEDRQAMAKQCGTSVDMLERNYSFAIEDLEGEGPKPA